MKSWCLNQMRREYRGKICLCILCAAIFLALGLILLMIGSDGLSGRQRQPVAIGCLAAAVLCCGLYLAISDQKWLFSHTALGRFLKGMGPQDAVLDHLDRQAAQAVWISPVFMLTEKWLILFLPSPSRLDPWRKVTLPIPKSSLFLLRYRKERKGYKVLVDFQQNGHPLWVFLEKEADIRALQRWTQIREMEADEQ